MGVGDPCARCHGTRHVRQDGHWVRCTCIVQALSTAFVHPILRGQDTTPPTASSDALYARTATLVRAGSWDTFRHTAWASLLAYEPQGITHDVVFFHRFADIKVGAESADHDPDVLTLRDLVRLDILIVVISAHDIANRLTRSVFGNLLTERTNSNRATWVFTHVTGGPLRALLDEPIARRWFDSLADAYSAPPPVSSAPRSGRPGADARVEPADAPGGGAARWYR